MLWPDVLKLAPEHASTVDMVMHEPVNSRLYGAGELSGVGTMICGLRLSPPASVDADGIVASLNAGAVMVARPGIGAIVTLVPKASVKSRAGLTITRNASWCACIGLHSGCNPAVCSCRATLAAPDDGIAGRGMTEQTITTLSGSIGAGLSCSCPRCGKGKLFQGFLTLQPHWEHCGLSYAFADFGRRAGCVHHVFRRRGRRCRRLF